jgi:hypothetical protein
MKLLLRTWSGFFVFAGIRGITALWDLSTKYAMTLSGNSEMDSIYIYKKQW